MAIQGLRDTSNFVTDQRPKNFREGILLLYPNGQAPLTALTSLMKSKNVDDPEFYWWEKEMESRRVALGANLGIADTTMTVASGAKGFVEGDLLISEQNGEVVAVTADPGSDTVIPISRAFAGTTAAAITYAGAGVNPNFVCMGNAFEEGSLPPTGVNFDPSKVYNYTQIFRKTLEITRTAAKTRLRTGDAVKEAKRECLEIISNDMERAFWHGVKGSTTKNGKPLHTMSGVDAFIAAANKKTADTATGCTMENLEEFMKGAFDYGSSEKMGFCGNRALLTIQQIIRKNSTWNIQNGLKEYGMSVSRLVCPFGELVLKTHPLWNTMTGGTTGGTAYYGREAQLSILDMKEIQYVTFKDDDLKYQPDLQANGLDGMQAGYLAEVSIEMHFPKAHYQIKNLAKAAKDA